MLLTRALECGDAIILMSHMYLFASVKLIPTDCHDGPSISSFVWLYGREIVRTPQVYYTGADYTIWG